MRASDTPVLVLGSGLTVLGVIRLLSGAGRVPLVISEQPGLERWSRFYRAAPPSSSNALPDKDLTAYLRGLPIEQAVLLPCSDHWTLRVANCTDRVQSQFRTSLSSANTLERVIDKWYLAELLEQLRLPHPKTLAVNAQLDVDEIPDDLLNGAFIKPRDSASFFRRFGVKALISKSRTDLTAQLATIAEAGLAVEIQEYVPGPPENHYYVEGFIDRHGTRTALFVRQRLRMYPPDFGNSTAFVSVPPDAVPDAVDTVMTLLNSVGFRGIFSVELKRDQRDGFCRLIEVNARPWWYIEFAGQCGVNVAEMYVQDALGESVTSVNDYVVGRTCVYPYYDLHACRSMKRAGTLSASHWVRSWLSATQPVLRWNDPIPAIASTSGIIGDRVKRIFGQRGRQ